MTYHDICRRLTNAGISEAECDAALLLERYCGVSRAALPLHRDEQFDSPELSEAVARREARYPLQYILGTWGFYGLELEVAPGVLIPRPDTEIIVDNAVRRIGEGGRFADLGCGSGCISLAILAARGDVSGVAVDISDTALSLTQRNAARCSVADRLEVRRGDMLSPEWWRELGTDEKFDAIISNPPYIARAELAELAPELGYEPALALDGGDDGLDFYRILISRGVTLLRRGGVMIFECGVGQTAAIAGLGRGAGLDADVLEDIEGRDRGVVLGLAAGT